MVLWVSSLPRRRTSTPCPAPGPAELTTSQNQAVEPPAHVQRLRRRSMPVVRDTEAPNEASLQESASRRVELFDRVSKHSGVVSNPRIARHDGHELWRLAEQFCGRKMHRIERTNRFYGKGATNTREHG